MFRNIARCITAFALLFIIGLVVTVNQVNQIYLRTPKADAVPVVFTIDESIGGTFAGVASKLKEAGLIQNTFWFRVAGELSGKTNDIQLGTFDLKSGMNYQSILSAITSTNVNEVSVTIPEGLSIKQMGEIVASKLSVSKADWEKATGVHSTFEGHPFVIAAQKPDSVDLEGYLFPDTYRFFKTATAEDVVKKMIDTMALKYADAVKDNENTEAKKLGFTPHDYLVLASIVEKEVRLPTTMKVVSGIFMNRLSINMALQVDSSVNYITGGDDPSVSYADLQIDSPYNTYKYRGLPPGPISAPGANALFAVFHPTETEYMYFLTTDAGDVRYSKTLEQHNEYKAMYLR